MKKCKLLLWALALACSWILTGCRAANQIYSNMYIASIGFEHQEDEYTGYFFLPSSMSVGNTDSGSSDKNPSEIAVVRGKTIADVFNNLDLSTTLKMNLKHISSIVLHESILNEKDLQDLMEYVKSSNTFDYNFYIFTTKDEIQEIYQVKNPNEESVILTMLCEPISSAYAYTAANPPHFLNFCRDYYNGKVLSFALIEPTKIWSEENDSTYCRGVAFYKGGKLNIFGYEEEENFEFFKSNASLSYSDDYISVLFTNYQVKISYKEEVNITVKSKYKVLYFDMPAEKSYLEEKIQADMLALIEKYEKDIDFLNLQYNASEHKNVKVSVDFKKS